MWILQVKIYQLKGINLWMTLKENTIYFTMENNTIYFTYSIIYGIARIFLIEEIQLRIGSYNVKIPSLKMSFFDDVKEK